MVIKMVAQNANLLYPNQHQLQNVYDEGSSPHLYNYFALHGFQCFMQRTKKLYKVWARGWIPRKYVDEYQYSTGWVDYFTCVTLDINKAMVAFKSLALELIGSNRYSCYNEKNPLISDVVSLS